MTDEEKEMDGLMEAAGAEWRRDNGPSADFASRIKAALAEERKSAQAVTSTPAKVIPLRQWLTVAAAVLILATGGVFMLTYTPKEEGSMIYSVGEAIASAETLTDNDTVVTGEGGEAIVSLDEGRVSVFLAENTSLKIAGEDRLWLENGEVWVSVKAESGFFEVQTPSARVTVMGTKFGVTHGEDGSHVRIVSGKVKVEGGGAVSELNPGSSAHVSANGAAMAPETSTEGLQPPAWASSLESNFRQSAAAQRYPSGWSSQQP